MPAAGRLHTDFLGEGSREPPAPKLKGPGGWAPAGEGVGWCGCPPVGMPTDEGTCWIWVFARESAW